MTFRELLLEDALRDIRSEVGPLSRLQEIAVEQILARLADDARQPPRRRDRQGHFVEGGDDW